MNGGGAGRAVTVALGPEQLAAVARGHLVRVSLGARIHVGDVDATSALVGRVDGAWRAYANVCRHRQVALDLGADSAMSDDGLHLLCHQHGALYRPSDGVCVAGPCAGDALVPIAIDGGEAAVTLRF
jgi:nitrite reductase/ring-hydroxylating ferredoxin subunit